MKTLKYDMKKNIIPLLGSLVLSFIFISFFWRRDLSNYNVATFGYYYFLANNLCMLYIIANLYIEDFKYGAIKNLYVFSKSLIKLIGKRLGSSLVIGSIFYIFSQINVLISYAKLQLSFGYFEFIGLSIRMLVIYLLIAAFIASYVGFVANISDNHRLTYIIAIVLPLIIQYFIPLAIFASQNSNSGLLKVILKFIPNSSIFSWTSTWVITNTEFILFAVWICALSFGAYQLLRRKDVG